MSRTTSITSSSTYAGRTMTLSCTQTTNGSSANTSTIKWTLTSAGGANYYETGPTTIVIAGAQRYYKARTSWNGGFPASPGSVEGTFTLAHKQDGSIDPIDLSLSTAVYYGAVQTNTQRFVLESIARYFSTTPTLTLKSKTETSLTFDWETSETCSNILIHFGDDSQTISVNETSGSFTLSGLAVGESYSVYGEFTRKDSGLKSNSITTSYSTHDYPYITAISKDKLKIGEAQVVTVYNPLGRTVKIRATKNAAGTGSKYAETTITGTSATFTPNANMLYAAIPNSQTGTIYYNCFYNNSITNSRMGNFEILGTEVPTFDGTRFSFKDSDTSVTAITAQGKNGWLVQSLSTLKVTLDLLATGNKNAKISKYNVTIAGNTIAMPGAVGSNVSFTNLNLSGEQTLSIKVTDSRGLTATGTKKVIFKPYSSPTINLVAKRGNNYGEKVQINAYFSSSSVEGLNGIKVSWSGASQSGYLKGSSTTFDKTQSTSAEKSVNGVDNHSPFTFSATITDRFGRTSSSQSNISIGVPVMFVDYEQNGVGVNCFPQGEGLWTSSQNGGGLFIDGKPATGTKVYEFDLETMPNNLFYPMIFPSNDSLTNVCHFDIGSNIDNAEAPYNNVITGWGRGGGQVDQTGSYHIQHIKGKGGENVFLSFGEGSGDFRGIYFYVRGGVKYRVETPTDNVILSTEDITVDDAFFPAGVTNLSTATNISAFISKWSFDSWVLKKEYISGDVECNGIGQFNSLRANTTESIHDLDANGLKSRVILAYAYNLTNLPDGETEGYFINIPRSYDTGSNNFQMFTTPTNKQYTRVLSEGTWSGWNRIGGEPTLIVSSTQPDPPASGYIIWVDAR